MEKRETTNDEGTIKPPIRRRIVEFSENGSRASAPVNPEGPSAQGTESIEKTDPITTTSDAAREEIEKLFIELSNDLHNPKRLLEFAQLARDNFSESAVKREAVKQIVPKIKNHPQLHSLLMQLTIQRLEEIFGDRPDWEQLVAIIQNCLLDYPNRVATFGRSLSDIEKRAKFFEICAQAVPTNPYFASAFGSAARDLDQPELKQSAVSILEGHLGDQICLKIYASLTAQLKTEAAMEEALLRLRPHIKTDKELCGAFAMLVRSIYEKAGMNDNLEALMKESKAALYLFQDDIGCCMNLTGIVKTLDEHQKLEDPQQIEEAKMRLEKVIENQFQFQPGKREISFLNAAHSLMIFYNYLGKAADTHRLFAKIETEYHDQKSLGKFDHARAVAFLQEGNYPETIKLLTDENWNPKYPDNAHRMVTLRGVMNVLGIPHIKEIPAALAKITAAKAKTD